MNFTTPKLTWRRVAARMAAGSLFAAAVVAALTPFNMGGCSPSSVGSTIGSVASGVTGVGGGGGRGNFTGNQAIDVGLAAVEGFQALSLNEQDERAMGQSVALSLTNKYRTVEDEQLNKYVTMVAQTLVNQMRQGGQVYVGVLDTNEMNAFAGPQGYIFVTRGALLAMEDEAELAGVLGHEIAHVHYQHGLKATQTGGVLGAVVKGGSAAAGQRDGPWVSAMGDLVEKLITSSYGQDQERQSDSTGLLLAARAGYDPNGFTRFLGKLRARSGGGAKIFSTHPGLSERIKNANSQIARESYAGRVTNAPRYKTNVLDRLR
jgi:predicted Zn-dependent protease